MRARLLATFAAILMLPASVFGDEYEDKFIELMKLTAADKMQEQVRKSIFPMVKNNMKYHITAMGKARGIKIDQAKLQAMIDKFSEEFHREFSSGFQPAVIAEYRKTFTQKDIEYLIKIYGDSEFQRLLPKLLKLTAIMPQLGAKLGKEAARKAIDKMKDEFSIDHLKAQ